MDDSTLIAKIIKRDRHALLVFYRRFTPKLSRYIGAKVSSQFDAEEILQDTLFAFLEALRDYQGKASIKTFLYAICSHKIVDFYRKKKVKQLLFSQMPNLESLISPLLAPEEELDMTILKEKIRHVFSSILPQYRRILTLKYIENRSVEEIARKLALTFKSAESQLFRARKAFVEAFISI